MLSNLMRSILVLTLILGTYSLKAENNIDENDGKRTLFQNVIIEHWGGYGAPIISYTQFGNNFGLVVGGKGGFIMNHHVAIGGAGMALMPINIHLKDFNAKAASPELKLAMGYGGIILEYYILPKSLVSMSVGTLLGAGGLGFYSTQAGVSDGHGEAFFICEPEVNFYLNLLTHFRVGLGAKYRLTAGIDQNGLTDKDFRGFSATIAFQIGQF